MHCVHTHTHTHIYIYKEKLKNKVIQSDDFIVKESRRYNVSVLRNYHQNFKNDGTNFSPYCRIISRHSFQHTLIYINV